MPASAMVAAAGDRPVSASIAASIGTMSGNYENVPPHLFATASDGEAFVNTMPRTATRCRGSFYFASRLRLFSQSTSISP